MASNLQGNEFDLPGVPWVCYISWTGVSFHGTYWHNNYGTPQSHGCINLTPEAAKWIYRWFWAKCARWWGLRRVGLWDACNGLQVKDLKMKGMKLSVNHIKSITSFKKALVIFIFVFFSDVGANQLHPDRLAYSGRNCNRTSPVVTQVITQIILPLQFPETPAATKLSPLSHHSLAYFWSDFSTDLFPARKIVWLHGARWWCGNGVVGWWDRMESVLDKDLSTDTIIAYAQRDRSLRIVNGPLVQRGWIVWLVRMADGTIGYTPKEMGIRIGLANIRITHFSWWIIGVTAYE